MLASSLAGMLASRVRTASRTFTRASQTLTVLDHSERDEVAREPG